MTRVSRESRIGTALLNSARCELDESTAATSAMASPATTVSVVIPAYNRQSVIARSLASACSLTGAALDIVVVNDGSTDATSDALHEFAALHKNVRIISQPNRGLSAARNAGISAASGEYIIFLDAGDELLPVDLAPLLTAADMHAFGAIEVRIDGTVALHAETSHHGTGAHYLQQRLRAGRFVTMSWKYVYSSSFLRKSGVRFTEGLLHEDMLFSVEALLAAGRVDATDLNVYRYVRTPNSITTTQSHAHVTRRIASLDSIVSRLRALQRDHPDLDIDRYRVRVLRYANGLAARSGVPGHGMGVLRRLLQIGWLHSVAVLRRRLLAWRSSQDGR